MGGIAARMRCDKHLANKRRKIIWYTITTNQNNFNELNRRPLFRRAYRGGNEKIILILIWVINGMYAKNIGFPKNEGCTRIRICRGGRPRPPERTNIRHKLCGITETSLPLEGKVGGAAARMRCEEKIILYF